MTTRLLVAAACLCASAFAQDYTLRYVVNKSGAAAVATIQQPASSARRVNFTEVTISLSAATTVTIERDCTTPASATAQELQPVNPLRQPTLAKARGFVDSDATGCTIVHGPIAVPASSPVTIRIPKHYLVYNGAANNLTVRTASLTATGSINVGVTEVNP